MRWTATVMRSSCWLGLLDQHVIQARFRVLTPEHNRSALGPLLDQLYELIESRERERPSGSYTTYLFEEGLDKILKKVGEESAETIIAAKNDDDARVAAETADLLYHLLVLLVARGVSLKDVAQELAQRRKGRGENRA